MVMVIGDDKHYTAVSLDNSILLPLHYHYLETKMALFLGS